MHELRDEDAVFDLDGRVVELRRLAKLSWVVSAAGRVLGTLVELPAHEGQLERDYLVSSATEQRVNADWPDAVRWLLESV